MPRKSRHKPSMRKSTLASKVSTLQRKVRVLKPETKYIQGSASTTTSASGIIYQLDDVDQGDTVATREGNKIRLKSVSIRGDITGNGASQVVRVVLFQWSDTTAPIFGTLFSTSNDVFSPILRTNPGHAKILYDKTFSCKYSSTGTVNNLLRIRKYFKSGPTSYADGTGTNILRNNLYLGFISNVVTSDPVHYFHYETTFTDV